MLSALHLTDRGSRDRPLACVTGAYGNIGRAVASRLARDGYEILITVYSADEGVADEPGAPLRVSAAEAVGLGQEQGWSVVDCDLGDADDCRQLVALIADHFGRLDCLVNNAATWTYARLVDLRDDDWRRVLEVNLVAVVRLVQEAYPLLRAATAPRVVNIGSSCGFLPEAGVGPYCISKAAVHAATRWMAIELADDGILVNAVAPGFIRTGSNATYLDEPETLRRRLETIPLGRPGTVDEVAHIVSVLASPELGFVTGEVVRCDGGFLSGAARTLMSS